jgi:hypothetical protein
MNKFYFYITLSCIFIACSNQSSLSDYGKTLFNSLKEHDFESFEKLSLISNKQLRFQIDTLLHEPVSPTRDKERRDNVKKNFFGTRQELIDQGCVWDQAKFLGFNYNLESAEAEFKMYNGELIFESNGKQFKVDAGRIIQKGNSDFYALGSFPLTVRK